MSERCMTSRDNRFDALVHEIMKALHLDGSAAVAMAADMVMWELLIAFRTPELVPETAQSVA